MVSQRPHIPFSWIFDRFSGQPVETKADPPRIIRADTCEDGEYLEVHVDLQEKLGSNGLGGSDSNLILPSSEESQRRHSFHGLSSLCLPLPHAVSIPATGSGKPVHRGFFGMLKDKAIGTKEERLAEWHRRQEEDRLLKEREAQRHSVINTPCGGVYGPHQRRQGGGAGIPMLGLATGMVLGGGFGCGGGVFG
jgi:hypothetical protein